MKIEIGDILPSNFCGLFRVIERAPGKIRIKFLKTSYENWYSKESVHRGEVNDPMLPVVYDRGYYGDSSVTGCMPTKLRKKAVETWHSMFKRCYSERVHEGYPTYQKCEVSPLWYNLQNFAKFFLENYRPKWELDKDLLVKGNRTYGPETCVYLPRSINGYIKTNKSRRGNYAIGVSLSYMGDSFEAKCRDFYGKQINLGKYATEEAAFLVYKEFKESIIRQKAFTYKDELSYEAFSALVKFEVNFDD